MLLVVLYQVMIHLESLQSTQEARVVLGNHPEQPLTLLSCSPNFPRALYNSMVHVN